jgi:hypothetical protein
MHLSNGPAVALPKGAGATVIPSNSRSPKSGGGAIFCQQRPTGMSDITIIESALERAARRRRLQRALNGLALGLLTGGAALLLAIAAYKVFPIPYTVIPIAGMAAGVCALLGFVIGGWNKHSLLQTARWVDDRQQLKELSTALELSGKSSGKPAPEDWKHLLLSDAAHHAQALDPRRLFVLRFPSPGKWALAVMALCVGLGFVPEYRSKAFVQKQADTTVIKDVAKNLSELTRRELAQKPPVLPPTQKAMEQVAEMGDKLGKQTLTRGEALKDLASITKQLAQQEKELSQNPAMERRVSQAMARRPHLNRCRSRWSRCRRHWARPPTNPRSSTRWRRKCRSSSSRPRTWRARIPPAARPRRSSSRNPSPTWRSRRARLALRSTVSTKPSRRCKETTRINSSEILRRLPTLRDMAKAMQSLQQQASKMGKDLAEQLKQGQAQAAQQTLQKMIDQLKTAQLSKEQLDKIMKEVDKAVDPASQYGKVAEHLKQAAGQCKGGDKPGASQSLAEAQKELQKMLDQMSDAQAMQATLDALERAQWAIANGKCWSQCQGQGDRPGFGQGGKPGRGVGTWADEENGWTYFPPNGASGWDNSGIERPDMDPRGLTDRPADLNPNLMPDKVKGQMAPGGSMPSITLKGVSIKGNSTVKFEEAAASAQQDAQSALNQDHVPRPYQNAVRDYFDDLKK